MLPLIVGQNDNQKLPVPVDTPDAEIIDPDPIETSAT
jgi:hypothetical protein